MGILAKDSYKVWYIAQYRESVVARKHHSLGFIVAVVLEIAPDEVNSVYEPHNKQRCDDIVQQALINHFKYFDLNMMSEVN